MKKNNEKFLKKMKNLNKVVVGGNKILIPLTLILMVGIVSADQTNNIIWQIGSYDKNHAEFNPNPKGATHYYVDTSPINFPKDLNDGYNDRTKVYIYYDLTDKQAKKDTNLMLCITTLHSPENSFKFRIKVNDKSTGDYYFTSSNSCKTIDIGNNFNQIGENVILIENTHPPLTDHWILWDYLELKIKECPYDCCVDDRYYDKFCSVEEECKENKCIINSCKDISCPDKCVGDVKYYHGKCQNGECKYETQTCPYKCENGKCKLKDIGDSCSSDSECEGKQCYNGVCKEQGYCEGEDDCSTNQYCENNKCKDKSKCPSMCCPDNDRKYYPKPCEPGYECVDYECIVNDISINNHNPPFAKITCLPTTDQSPAKLSLQIKTYTGSHDVSAELTIYLPDGVEKHGTIGAFTCTQSICTTKKIDILAGDVKELVLEVQSNKPQNYNLFSGEVLWKWAGSTESYNKLPLDTSNCDIFVGECYKNSDCSNGKLCDNGKCDHPTPPEPPWWQNQLFIIAIVLIIVILVIVALLRGEPGKSKVTIKSNNKEVIE